MPGFLFSKVQRSLVVFRKAGTTVSAPSQPAAATPGAILAIVVTIITVAVRAVAAAGRDEETAVPRAATPGVFHLQRLLNLCRLTRRP